MPVKGYSPLYKDFLKHQGKKKPRKLPKRFQRDFGIMSPDGTYEGINKIIPADDEIVKLQKNIRDKREVATNKTINSNRVPTFTRKG